MPDTCPFHLAQPAPCELCDLEDEIGDERRAVISVANRRRRGHPGR